MNPPNLFHLPCHLRLSTHPPSSPLFFRGLDLHHAFSSPHFVPQSTAPLTLHTSLLTWPLPPRTPERIVFFSYLLPQVFLTDAGRTPMLRVELCEKVNHYCHFKVKISHPFLPGSEACEKHLEVSLGSKHSLYCCKNTGPTLAGVAQWIECGLAN